MNDALAFFSFVAVCSLVFFGIIGWTKMVLIVVVVAFVWGLVTV